MNEPRRNSVDTSFHDTTEQPGLQWVAGHNGGQRTLSFNPVEQFVKRQQAVIDGNT